MRERTLEAIEGGTLPHSLGYSTPGEYHRDASSQHYIPSIRTPSLFLAAQDDPFVGYLPKQECSANPNTVLAVTARGGHVGFLTGAWPFKSSWMDHVLMDFLETALDTRAKRQVAESSSSSSATTPDPSASHSAEGVINAQQPDIDMAEAAYQPTDGEVVHPFPPPPLSSLSSTFKNITVAKRGATVVPMQLPTLLQPSSKL